ncbi:MAG TPA: endolytic transglycosylase MltG, partial [Candidatus Paceibacterota bacterium]|nr:endolytic transglycosylase MltG [Candidatus Paceibacterota bacterium]
MDSGSLKYIPEPAPELYLPPVPPPSRRPSSWRLLLAFLVLFVISVLLYLRFVSASPAFPSDSVFSVPAGQGLSGAADRLRSAGYIRSEFGFKAVAVLFGGSKGLKAGDYYFQERVSAATVAWRLTKGIDGLKGIRVTIPEGLSVREIADLVAKDKRLAHFDRAEFVRLAAPYEGYLFPDTYLFLPSVTSRQVMDTMLQTYKDRIEALRGDLAVFGKPIQDVIRMASILEEEGRTEATRQTIAGILWKRLAEGMPLQVDASLVYATGKKSGDQLAPDDFKMSSPYNT